MPRTVLAVLALLVLAGCATGGGGLGQGQSCGGVAGLQCQARLYCAYPPKSCRAPDAEGSCMAKPAICPKVSEPICGCDGKTYDNTCLAAQAGVSPISAGVCPDQHRLSLF